MPQFTSSQNIVEELMTALVAVRKIEQTTPYIIPHEYGNLLETAHNTTPRLTWRHEGGVILEKVSAPEVEAEDTEVTVPAVGVRKARYRVRIWMKTQYECETVLDQLVTAGLQLARPEQVSFQNMQYTVPTQVTGKWSEHGEIIDAYIDIKPSVAAVPVPEDPNAEVTVEGFAFRAGIENPPGEPEDDSEYDVVRPEPWPG